MQIKRTLATIVSRIVVDLGTGSGRSIKHLLEVMKKGFIIGLDGSCKRLATAKKMLKFDAINLEIALICCNFAYIPLKSSVTDSIVSILTFHELVINKDKNINDIAVEMHRILKKDGEVIVIDKFLYETENLAEKLPILTEYVYQEALKTAKGIHLWGLHKPEDYINILRKTGFKNIKISVIDVQKRLSGEEFLKTWGKETRNLIKQIKGPKAERLKKIIKKIEKIALNYGYKAGKMIIVRAKK